MMTDFQLDPKETAVVFIEYQNEFTTPNGKLHEAVKDVMDKTNMLDNSVKFANGCRDMGVTILHVPITFESGHHEIGENPYGILAGVKDGAAFENGTWGAEFCSAMTPKDGDLVVKGKSGLCGFESTNLDFLLRQRNIKNVILGGFLTNCCVESTMRTAYEKGYKVYTLKDCVAATSMAAQDATLEYNFGMFSVPTTSDEVLKAIVVAPQSWGQQKEMKWKEWRIYYTQTIIISTTIHYYMTSSHDCRLWDVSQILVVAV